MVCEVHSIQTLEDDFVQESHQLASELNCTETLLSHLNDETVSESRSADDDAITNDELRSAQHDTTINDEERSKTPPPLSLRSKHYNLQNNPPQTSYSNFDIKNYRYSFL